MHVLVLGPSFWVQGPLAVPVSKTHLAWLQQDASAAVCVCCLQAITTIGRHRTARSAVTNITSTIAWSMCLKVHSHNSKAHCGSRGHKVWASKQPKSMFKTQDCNNNPSSNQQCNIFMTHPPLNAKTHMFPWCAYCIQMYGLHTILFISITIIGRVSSLQSSSSSDIVQLCYQ
jgi:hypothetical protein